MPRTNIPMARTAAGRRKSVINYANALYFDGVDGTKMNVGNGVYGFEYTDPFSISFDINILDDSDLNADLFSQAKLTSPFTGIYLRSTTGGTLRLWLIGSAGTSATTRIDFPKPPNGYSKLVVTYDGSGLGSGMNAYYNKTLQSTSNEVSLLASSIINVDNPTNWGTRINLTDVFKGYMSHMRIWDVELTQAQVNDLYYDDKVPGVTPLDEYLCTEGSGTAVASTGSAGNNGVLTAVTWEPTNVPSKARSVISQPRLSVS